jgi:hypothetical protein
MWIFNSKNYINHAYGLFQGCSWVLIHSPYSLIVHGSHLSLCYLSPFTLSPIHHSSFILILAWEGKMNCWRGVIVLLVIMIVGVFQP